MSCRTVLCLCSFFWICASAHAELFGSQALSDITRIYNQTPSLSQFEVCQGGGCLHYSSAALSSNEWRQVARLFTPSSISAEQERLRIAKAIGLLEEIVGHKVGTSGDVAGTFNDGLMGQQDCNDEAANTTTYLKLLIQTRLVRFHQKDDFRTRNFFFSGWPHTTASIKEIATGTLYAVDSWFYHNGHDAVVVPLSDWKANYKPADSPVYQTKSQ